MSQPAASPARPREPVFNAPLATLLLAAGLVLLHALRLWFVDEDWRLVVTWGFMPLRLMAQLDPEGAAEAVRALATAAAAGRDGGLDQVRAALGDYGLDLAADVPQTWATLVTHAGLHGSWAHVVINSVWLVAFGSAVNRRLGSARFLGLGAVTAIAGALAQMLVDPYTPLPMVGASGMVSGFTGAMARFAFAPGAPLGPWRAPADEAYYFPAPPISAVWRDQRALIFVVSWFALNFLSGAAVLPFGGADAPVAWVAHMGGFIAGFFLFGSVDPVGPATRRLPPDDFSSPGELRG